MKEQHLALLWWNEGKFYKIIVEWILQLLAWKLLITIWGLNTHLTSSPALLPHSRQSLHCVVEPLGLSSIFITQTASHNLPLTEMQSLPAHYEFGANLNTEPLPPAIALLDF